jgi:hypothetical protein
MRTAAKSISPEEQPLSLNDFVPLEELVESYPQFWPTMQSARWAIHTAEKNGLAEYGVFTKKASRWYAIMPRLLAWAASGTK